MQKLGYFERLCCSVFRAGAVPEHIGFIMDGNRRHAKRKLMKSPIEGHQLGVESLKKTLLICKELGVQMMSLFCFSIENFNRSKEEVEGLMALCLETFQEMSSMQEILLGEQIKVNIVGQVELLREDVRNALKTIEEKTSTFTKMEINLCFAYDGLHEAQTALARMDQTGTYEDFLAHLQIRKPLDVLVRTANDSRLSNFMLAQCQHAYICILNENWPEINMLSFVRILLEYNYSFKEISAAKA